MEGLSPLGRQAVARMNQLGMMVDISHTSDDTFYDALGVTKAPLIASHSSCRALCRAPRNMTDDMIRALAKNGGVMDINYYSGFLPAETTATAKIEKQVDEEISQARARYAKQGKRLSYPEEVGLSVASPKTCLRHLTPSSPTTSTMPSRWAESIMWVWAPTSTELTPRRAAWKTSPKYLPWSRNLPGAGTARETWRRFWAEMCCALCARLSWWRISSKLPMERVGSKQNAAGSNLVISDYRRNSRQEDR